MNLISSGSFFPSRISTIFTLIMILLDFKLELTFMKEEYQSFSHSSGRNLKVYLSQQFCSQSLSFCIFSSTLPPFVLLNLFELGHQ